jgi:peptidoglycan-associated lipoprotein
MSILKFLWTVPVLLSLAACNGGESQIVRHGNSEPQAINPNEGQASSQRNGGSVQPEKNKQNGVEVIGLTNKGEPSEGRLNGEALTPDEIAAAEKAKQAAMNAFPPAVYFDYNAYKLSPEGLATVQHYAKILVASPQKKITLTGNTDERGTPEYNLALGEKRAKSVAEVFMLYGVSENQINVLTMGEENPVDDAHNEAAWAKNRRVDIKIN